MDIKIILKSGRCITRDMNYQFILDGKYLKIMDYNGEIERLRLSAIHSIIGPDYTVLPL